MNYVLGFGAAFVYVMLKASQQLNVVQLRMWPIIPVSIAMCACEFYLVTYMVAIGPNPLSILVLGIGAGLGALLTMYFYKRKEPPV